MNVNPNIVWDIPLEGFTNSSTKAPRSAKFVLKTIFMKGRENMSISNHPRLV